MAGIVEREKSAKNTWTAEDPELEVSNEESVAPVVPIGTTEPVAEASSTKARERFTIYARKSNFERLALWSEELRLTQAELIDHAIADFCDGLAAKFNDGQDPVRRSIELPSLKGS